MSEDKLEQIKAALQSPDRDDFVQCVDGFAMDVFAGPEFYSHPRGPGPWESFEIINPKRYHPELMPHLASGNRKNPKQGVYAYVPIDIVANIILKHGGFK